VINSIKNLNDFFATKMVCAAKLLKIKNFRKADLDWMNDSLTSLVGEMPIFKRSASRDAVIRNWDRTFLKKRAIKSARKNTPRAGRRSSSSTHSSMRSVSKM
jgi:hypothetical protein